MIPVGVIQIRQELCQGKCKANPTDPCAACENGHWGRYEQRGCDGSQRSEVRGQRRSEGLGDKIERIANLIPGDIFASVIYQITGIRTSNCGVCGKRKRQMNEWGWLGCWRNRNTIVGWLIEEAGRRGHPVEGKSVAVLFRAAFAEARRAKQNDHPQITQINTDFRL